MLPRTNQTVVCRSGKHLGSESFVLRHGLFGSDVELGPCPTSLTTCAIVQPSTYWQTHPGILRGVQMLSSGIDHSLYLRATRRWQSL